MKERTVHKRIIKSKCLADTFVWLGYEYKKTEKGYEFERTWNFDLAWRAVHSLKEAYRNK